MILAGDIGATNTRLAWFDVADRALVPGAVRTYPSQRHAGLEEIAARSCARRRGRPGTRASGSPARCGTAGSRGRTCRGWWTPGTSPPLSPRRGDPPQRPGGERVGPGDPPRHGFRRPAAGPRGADGQRRGHLAGTGLGEAGLVWDGRRHRPVASEAGHATGRPKASCSWRSGGSSRPSGARQRGARALGPGAPQHLPIPAGRAGPDRARLAHRHHPPRGAPRRDLADRARGACRDLHPRPLALRLDLRGRGGQPRAPHAGDRWGVRGRRHRAAHPARAGGPDVPGRLHPQGPDAAAPRGDSGARRPERPGRAPGRRAAGRGGDADCSPEPRRPPPPPASGGPAVTAPRCRVLAPGPPGSRAFGRASRAGGRPRGAPHRRRRSNRPSR